MRQSASWIVVPACALIMFWASGCTVKTKTTTTSSSNSSNKSDHGHDHEHDHAHGGLHGGHIVEIGEEEYHAEWTHDDDTGKVTVYILDGAMKKEVPIEAEQIEIETKVADETTNYTLTAVNPSSGDKPAASQFAVEDKQLSVALHAAGSKGTEATLRLTIKDKPYEAKFEQHEHHH